MSTFCGVFLSYRKKNAVEEGDQGQIALESHLLTTKAANYSKNSKIGSVQA